MNIAIIGYGKMGRMIEEIAKQRGHNIVCIIDQDNQADFDSANFASADVAIEFTSPQAAFQNYLKAFKHNVKVVSGSTGWLEQHGEEIKHLCKEEGKTLFWASNFSVGVAIFRALNRRLAELMNRFPQYDVHMEETHHVHKQDAPSGTAITLAEDILAQLQRKDSWIKGKQHLPNQQFVASQQSNQNQLAIDSFREGEVPGIHTIIYNSEADSISISHNAHSRRGFAEGAVLAAEYTATHSGLLSMDNLFNF